MPKALFVSSNGLVSTGTRPHAHRLQVVQLSFLLVGFSLAQKSCGFGTEEFSVAFLVHFHLYLGLLLGWLLGCLLLIGRLG